MPTVSYPCRGDPSRFAHVVALICTWRESRRWRVCIFIGYISVVSEAEMATGGLRRLHIHAKRGDWIEMSFKCNGQRERKPDTDGDESARSTRTYVRYGRHALNIASWSIAQGDGDISGSSRRSWRRRLWCNIQRTPTETHEKWHRATGIDRRSGGHESTYLILWIYRRCLIRETVAGRWKRLRFIWEPRTTRYTTVSTRDDSGQAGRL